MSVREHAVVPGVLRARPGPRFCCGSTDPSAVLCSSRCAAGAVGGMSPPSPTAHDDLCHRQYDNLRYRVVLYALQTLQLRSSRGAGLSRGLICLHWFGLGLP